MWFFMLAGQALCQLSRRSGPRLLLLTETLSEAMKTLWTQSSLQDFREHTEIYSSASDGELAPNTKSCLCLWASLVPCLFLRKTLLIKPNHKQGGLSPTDSVRISEV